VRASIVAKARETKLDRDVAIKILPELFAADAERVARFEREAKALAALNHPHLAQICSVGEAPTPDAPAFAGSASFGVGPKELT